MKHLLIVLMILPILLSAGTLQLRLFFPEDADCGSVSAPQRLRQPVHAINVLLPAGASLESYEWEFGSGQASRHLYNELNGPWLDGERLLDAEPAPSPGAAYNYLGVKRWGDLSYASFQALPYDATKGNWHKEAWLQLRYQNAPEARKLIPPTFQNPAFFVNSASLQEWYQQPHTRNYDFLVVSTPELYSALGAWQSFRESQGLTVQFADIASILASQVGANNAVKLRNYLVSEYAINPFTYLMIVGDHNRVPVAYLTPEPNGSETVPSDFFYSDLSSNWDSDGDGRYGEYYSSIGQQDWQVDYTPEILVGRISTNFPSEVSDIAARIIDFESSNAPYKSKALLPAAFSNYYNEPDPNLPQTDNADLMELAKNTVLRHYDCDTMYEHSGVVPSYPSTYDLDYAGFNHLVRNAEYGLINWSAHGSTDSSSRKIWMQDSNGNNLPDPEEMEWENLVHKQSFTNINVSSGTVIFAASCFNGRIDASQSSLGEFALIERAVGVIAATRTGWYKPGWQNPGWGGLSSYNYHFLENYAEAGYSLGAAHAITNLLHTQYYLFGDPLDTGGIIWPELQNAYTYLLYGDPAVGHSVLPAPEGEILVYIPAGDADYRLINSLRESSAYNVIYSNRLIPDYEYLQHFAAIFCIMNDYAPSSWEYAMLNGYLEGGGKIYLEGNIAWELQEAFLGKFGVEIAADAPIQIQGISYPPKHWAYEAQTEDYRALSALSATATPVFFTDNVVGVNHCIGVTNVTAQYRSLAAALRLSEILDTAPGSNSFQEFVAVILDKLGLNPSGSDGVEELSPVAIPALSAWPNPATNALSIKLEHPDRQQSELSIYNIKGQLVHSFTLSAKNAFSHTWNAKDSQGKACPSGVYILKSGQLKRKFTLLP